MRLLQCLFPALSITILTGPILPALHAADGTWTQLTSGGLWSDSLNWSSGNVADGAGFTANFNTLNLTADNTVHLDSAREIGNLIFGDTTTATAGSWALDDNGNAANILTLAGTTPTVTVNTLGTGKTATISAAIAGTSGWTKAGAGTLTLSGANTYSGTTIINGTGTAAYTALKVSSNTALGDTNGGTTLNSGTSTTTFGTALELAPGVTVTGESLTINTTTGRASLLLNTAGTAAWNGNITSNSNASTPTALFSNVAGANLTIGVSSANTFTLTGAVNFVRGAGNGTVNSTITGTGSLSKTDAGTWTISHTDNDYSGTTAISTGALVISKIADGGQTSSLGTGSSITLGQNTAGSGGVGILRFSGASGGSSNRNIVINNGALGGGGTIENTVAGQTLTLSGNVTAVTPASASSFTLQGAGSGVLSGNITGSPAVAVTKAGSGTWILSGGGSTYTGATNITGGTLVAAHPSAFGPATNTINISTAAGGGILDLATDTSISAYPIAASSSFPATIASNRATPGNGITHALGSFFTGNNTYSFTAGANVTGGSAAVSLASLNLAGGSAGTTTLNPTTAALSILGAANIGSSSFAKTLNLGGTNAGNSISGNITNGLNTLALTKTGASTWALSGANTYTGATNVTDGTLVVNGSISGSVTSISGTGTLSGTGTVGTLNLNAGGTLNPGSGPGILNSGDVTFNGGTAVFELNGTTLGTQYDQLNVAGTVTLASATPLTLALGYTPTHNEMFVLVNNNLADGVVLNNLFTAGGNPILDDVPFNASGFDWELNYNGGDGNDIVLTAVPEPGTTVSMLSGLVLLMGLRRRRK